MKDDFDNGMGMPDEELAGETLSDVGDLGLDLEGEGGLPEQEPAGRHSGGARAKAASTPRKSSGASKMAKAPARTAARAAASRAKKPTKPTKRTGGKAAKKSARKSAKTKPAKKSAKRRKAGKKK
jgi:hypothetical protein